MNITRILVLTIFAGANCFGTALIDAVQNDDRAQVQALLTKHQNVNAKEVDGSTALAWASVRCNVEIATLLLKTGANPNLTNEHGIGPLYLAITNGSPAIVKLLLAKGADANLAKEDGETLLMTATRLGQIEVMKMLLEKGAAVNAREKKFGQTALMWAAGTPAATRLLIERGADVKATSKVWDITATIYTPTTSTIGKTGIPWNNDGVYASKQGGQNALLFAVHKHDLESARALLDAGVDVNIPAADGATPLLAALYKWDPLGKAFVGGTGAPAPSGSSAQFGADLPMASFLLDHGATVSVADCAGYTPLHGAALAVARITTMGRDRSAYGGGRAVRKGAGHKDESKAANPGEALAMVKRLLDAEADPNRQTLYPTSGPVGDVRINPAAPGSSPFHIAADSDSLELVKLLADRGANPNLLRKDGHTPFSVAVLSTDVEIVREMVARGASLTARYDPTDHFADPVKPISLTRRNQTIMHIAAGAAAPEVIEYLYSKGVPLDAKNSADETPLDLADHQERYREARAREGAEDKPDRTVTRDTSTTAAIKKLLEKKSGAEKLPTQQLIDLAVRKPESKQFQEALVASIPAPDLKAGTAALSDHGQALFAVETSTTPALFVDGAAAGGMKQIQGSPLWFAVVPLKTGRGHAFHYMLDGRKFGGKADVPSFGPDSYNKSGVPLGKLSEKTVFTSKIYDGMQSDYWVYTPAQYDPATPAALMVWDDGQQYINRDSASVRLLDVIDNLTYEKKLPVIVWVFTMPGIATMPEGTPFYQAVQKAAKADTQAARTSALRGVEYETLSGQYARFLNDELLAEVQSKYNIRKDAYSRAISGLSSGALGAFTAAWEQPDQISRVLLWVTPFTSGQWQPGVRDGGNIYPFKIRKEPKKNLRVWVQDGCDDAENANGSVPLQNIEVANSLKFREYDFHFSFGVGGHSPMQGSSELPESLTWLWRGYDPTKTQETYTMEDTEKSQPFFRVHIFNRE